MSWDRGLEAAFNPQSIAIVGASRDSSASADEFGRGSHFIAVLRNMGYRGRIYPVNPGAVEIQGLKAFPSISSIPDTVDLVIVSVKAERVPGVLEDCARGNAKNIHIFTSGFGETGTAEGRILEDETRHIAGAYGLRVMGPNCMGVAYVPGSAVATVDFSHPDQSGPVAFLSQSGGMCSSFLIAAQGTDIKFSKMISFGNATVIDAPDFMEYLSEDPESGIICMYLEGVRDGRRLFSLAREVNPRKPVVVWKAGTTESGARAMRSHTGALAGEARVWDAFFRQTGAVRVHSIEEMADVADTFLRLKELPRGRNAAIIGSGGGNSVTMAETCAAEGLQVPELSPNTVHQLTRHVSVAGRMLRNPMDLGTVYRDPDLLERCLDLVARDRAIDIMLVTLPVFALTDISNMKQSVEKVISLSRRCGKPVAVVPVYFMQAAEIDRCREAVSNEFRHSGVAFYSTFHGAVRALARVTEYHLFVRSLGSG